MRGLGIRWAELSLEKQLSIVIVPILLALFGLAPVVFAPSEDSGSDATAATPTATPTPDVVAYRKDVGAVCRDLDAAVAARHGDARILAGRLKRARSTGQQRIALIGDIRVVIARTEKNFVNFRELPAPGASRTLHARTVRAWLLNMQRLRLYRGALEASTGHAELSSILRRFSRTTLSAAEEDATDVRAGLKGLGGEECRFTAEVPTRVLTLRRVSVPPAPSSLTSPVPPRSTRRSTDSGPPVPLPSITVED